MPIPAVWINSPLHHTHTYFCSWRRIGMVQFIYVAILCCSWRRVGMVLGARLGWLSHAWSEPGLHSAKHAAHVTVFCSILIIFILSSGALNGSPEAQHSTDSNKDTAQRTDTDETIEKDNSKVPQPLFFILQLLRLLPFLALPQVSVMG